MINKAQGQTRTEIFLSKMCDNTFLKVWSYSNPIKDDKKEFCDLIAIFEEHMFIFFDREKVIKDDFLEKAEISWNRWYGDVIEAQTKTCHGAERYIRSQRPLFLDTELKTKLPIKFNPETVQVHKILIANGAREACKSISDSNLNGSLGISYHNIMNEAKGFSFPFTIYVDRENPVHVFDSHNLPILLSELDTFYDFKNYIVEKEKAIKKYVFLAYCGEEDLLAHYFINYDEKHKHHYIGTRENNVNGIMIGEGQWNDFILTPAYQSKKAADKVSYLWDRLLQKTCTNALAGRLGGNSDVFAGKSAINEMAKEPRFMRRALSENMINAINNFPENINPIIRNISYMPSYYENKAYIFLQLKVALDKKHITDYREVRQFMLEIACGAAKNKFPNLEMIIGIAVEPPKIYKRLSEDFILMDCRDWTKKKEDYYKTENDLDGMRFFMTSNLIMTKKHTKEFPNDKIR
jgi:hypothetical protein